MLPDLSLTVQRFQALGRRIADQLLAQLAQLHGIAAQPVDSPTDSPERTAFYRQLVNKSPSEIKAYWSRLVFSGGARPPVSPDSHAEQVRILASTPGAVSYVERSTVDSRVKIVFDFAQPTP